MSEELNQNFVAVIKRRDTEAARRLMGVSGLSNPNTWLSLFRLLCDIMPTEEEILKLLLSQADDEVLTKIFRAALERDAYRVVNLLMKERPNIDRNVIDEEGNTALHIAIQKESMEVVVSLCYKVPYVNARNKAGSSALHLAAVFEDEVVPYHLMDAGADCDLPDKLGRTPLHIAAIHNQEDVARQLILFGANVDATCNDNLTPLEYGGPLRTLKEHIIAMKALNVPVSERNLKLVDLSEKDRASFEYYQQEIEKLKTEMIRNTDISFYDLLTCRRNRLAVYSENEKLIDAADERLWTHPWYNGLIYKRVKLGKKRKKLLSQSLKSLEIAVIALFGKALPDVDIAYEIIDHLDNEDLENLIKAAPSAEICDS